MEKPLKMSSPSSSSASTASSTATTSTVARRPSTRYGGERRPRVYARVQYDDLQHQQQQQQQQQSPQQQNRRSGRATTTESNASKTKSSGKRDSIGDSDVARDGRATFGGKNNDANVDDKDGASGNNLEGPLKFYSCDLCDYKSKYRNHVKRHYLRHTEEKPFKCHLCHFEAKERYRFNKHLISAHPEEVDVSQDEMDEEVDTPFK